MTRKPTAMLALLVVLVLAAGCARVAGPGDGGSPSDDSPVSAPPQDPNSPIPSPSPRVVEPRDDIENPHPNAFSKAVAVDEDTVRVEYYLGVEECYGLDRVDVEYGQETVIITLFTGSVPGAEVCIDIAEFVVTIVDLAEPLNGREIVDGAVAEDSGGGY